MHPQVFYDHHGRLVLLVVRLAKTRLMLALFLPFLRFLVMRTKEFLQIVVGKDRPATNRENYKVASMAAGLPR